MKYAILCNTPYQLFVASCFVYGNCDSGDSIDLYVDIDNASQNTEIVKQMIKNQTFQNVYYLRRIIQHQNSLAKTLYKLRSYLNPRWMLKKSMTDQKLKPTDCYDVVLVSQLGAMAQWFIYAFPTAHIYFYEDGLGTYLRSNHLALVSKIDRCFQKLTGRGANKIKPEKVLLFCPDYYEGVYYDKLEKIVNVYMNSEVEAKVRRIFPQEDASVYSEYPIIYFGQPGDDYDKERKKKTIECEKAAVQFLINHVKEKVLVRPHPRQDASIYRGLKTDTRGISWELSCIDQINENTILIGRYSTAQFTPKILCGKEPIVVFTNLIYPPEDDARSKNIEDVIHRLIRIYSDKSKIYCPGTIEEFEELLLKLGIG